jgi:capsular polysaccharide biosynthesis protein
MGQGAADAAEGVNARDWTADDDQTVVFPRVEADIPRRAVAGRAPARAPELMPDSGWSIDDVTAEHPAAELARALMAGLTTLPYIGRAIRRRARMWCAAAMIGLVLGLAAFVVHPPAHKASVSLLITDGASQNPMDAILTEIALVQSRAVAAPVVQSLGLHVTVTKFLSSYTVTQVTDRVIGITASAPSASEAVRRASAIATQFLTYQANLLRAQQQHVVSSMDDQVDSLNQQIAGLDQQIAAAEPGTGKSAARHASAAEKAAVSQLDTDRVRDANAIAGLQQAISSYQVSNQLTNDQIISGSRILGQAAPLPPSKLKSRTGYLVIGLAAGLALGLGIVIVGALVSDRLRRRDDVARALGAPVELSVGRIRTGLLSGRRGLAAARGRDMQRIVAYLRGLLPEEPGGAPALAVVPVDDPRPAVLAVLSLALSCAEQGMQVLVADLSDGGLVARQLRVRDRGLRSVRVGGQKLTLVVPRGLLPAGPLASAGGSPEAELADQDLTAAYAAADLLLTIATVDPAIGADHLGSWATDTVVTVTTGQCAASRIRAAGDLIRLGGTSLVAAVLLDTDKTDDSIGTWPLPATIDSADLALAT